MSADAARLPLSGITVIDLSHVYNGPYATFLMAMAGADVIKVEPFEGEHLRSRGDMGGAAMPFAMLNSNKTPVTLSSPSGGGGARMRDGGGQLRFAPLASTLSDELRRRHHDRADGRGNPHRTDQAARP